MSRELIISTLSEKFNGNKQMTIDFLNQSIIRLIESQKLLETAIEASNIEDIKFYSHKIKYTCSLYNWSKLVELIKEIEIETPKETLKKAKQLISDINKNLQKIS